MNTVLYPGSFDPFTNGHLDILIRASHIFDNVIVAVVENIRKNSFLTLSERLEQIKKIIEEQNLSHKVRVITHQGLFVDLLKKENLTLVLRGIRVISDFETEMKMALNNKALYPEMETIFLFTNPIYGHISSSGVKEIYELGGDIKSLVPPLIYNEMRELKQK